MAFGRGFLPLLSELESRLSALESPPNKPHFFTGTLSATQGTVPPPVGKDGDKFLNYANGELWERVAGVYEFQGQIWLDPTPPV